MTKRILVVLTSHEKYPDMARATGVWLGEAVHFRTPEQLQWVGPAPLRTSRRSDMKHGEHVSSVRFPVGCIRASA